MESAVVFFGDFIAQVLASMRGKENLCTAIGQQDTGTDSDRAGATQDLRVFAFQAVTRLAFQLRLNTGNQRCSRGNRAAGIGKYRDFERWYHGRPGPFQHFQGQAEITPTDKYAGFFYPIGTTGENCVLG